MSAGRRTICFLAVFLFSWLASSISAHEIGTTAVRLSVNADRRWSLEITTAPTTLINRLEMERGLPPSRDLSEEQARERLQVLLPILARHMQLRFDRQTSPADPAIVKLEIPQDISLPSFVILRAEGIVPDHAQAVTWRYGLVFSTYALVFSNQVNGTSQTQWLEGEVESAPLSISGKVPPRGLSGLVLQYLELGFSHILPEGLDHILFVLGICLLSARWRPIAVQVTAFTIAHSVTLGLNMFDMVSLPSPIVEPLIALSVAYVGMENIVTRKLSPWRPIIVFCFGLLHGMGFAGVLRGLHLAPADIIPALVSFNIGIELAQLSIIAIAYFCFARWFQDRAWYRPFFVIPASAAIAVTGVVWAIERVMEI